MKKTKVLAIIGKIKETNFIRKMIINRQFNVTPKQLYFNKY